EKSRVSVLRVGHRPSSSRPDVFAGYTQNSEVRVYRRKDGNGFLGVPVRPIYNAGMGPVIPEEAGEFAFSLRRGSLFRLKAGLNGRTKQFAEGIYRVTVLPGEGDNRMEFLPHYIHAKPPGNGPVPRMRMDINRLAEFAEPYATDEPPHPPPPQS
ncbi:MAG: hypothetical protein ACOYMN_22995, partial [Roseimicrobium sp.]